MLNGTITADGRLFLPKPLLRSLGINGSTKVIISTEGDKIIINKQINTCRLCNGTLNMIDGFPVCRNCAEKVSELLKLT